MYIIQTSFQLLLLFKSITPFYCMKYLFLSIQWMLREQLEGN